MRTTIKLRRDDRRAKFSDAKVVAADGLKYAGRGAASASSSVAVRVWNSSITAIQTMIKLAIAGRQAMARTMQRSIAPAGRNIMAMLEPWLKKLAQSPLILLLGGSGVAAFHAAWKLSRGGGSRGELVLTAMVGVVALTAAILPVLTGQVRLGLPRGGARAGISMPNFKRLGTQQTRWIASAGLAGMLLVGSYMMTRPGAVSLASLGSFRLFGSPPVEGRATVVSGDIIRINATMIRLDGIEAPVSDQKCLASNKKKWACGEAAVAALGRIVKGKVVRCELSGADEVGRPLGMCQTVNAGTSQDVAAELVKEGAVFASGGLFSSLSALEGEAKAKNLGLWRGEAERPSDYRAKIWETAAKVAPDGCPIKGQVSGSDKTYVLPWSADYSGVRIRSAKGERWFCSEAEALAAGWKVAAR